MDKELNSFKSDIFLPEYAGEVFGYAVDRRESSRNSLVMRNPDKNDKVIIAKMSNGHFVYFSPYDPRDNGTIIDFIQKRTGKSLGYVRQELRPWVYGNNTRVSIKAIYPSLQVASNDHLKIIKEWNSLSDLIDSKYLETERAIGKEVYSELRFDGKIRKDDRGNLVFPHYDQNGICGLELKNQDFQGFSSGSAKGIWKSNEFDYDEYLVICESVIDCMSYHALYGTSKTRYIATSGAFSPLTYEMVADSVKVFPGRKIVLAFDNDKQGFEFIKDVQILLSGFPKEIQTQLPSLKDWNENLKERNKVASS